MKRPSAGFTLLELLVALGIMGIVFGLITSWQTSTLNISTQTNSTAQQLSELNDMTGYVGDRARSALAVRMSGFTVNAASAVNGGKCEAATPCLALLLPESDPDLKGPVTMYATSSTGTVGPLNTTGVRYRVYVYRMEPRSALALDDRTDDTWANTDANGVMVLREYRARTDTTPMSLCPADTSTAASTSTNCDAVAANFLTTSAFSSLYPTLVTDYLTLKDASNTAFTPFAYTPPVAATSTTPATQPKLTLSVQSKRQASGKITYTPATPYTLEVQARNVK